MAASERSPLLGRELVHFSVDLAGGTPPESLSGTLLGRCFSSIVQGETPIDPLCQKITRYSCKAFVVVCSGIVKVVFIPANLTLPVGPLFATGNIIAYFSIEYVNGGKIVDDVFGPKTQAQIELESHNKMSARKKIVIISSATLAGLIAQVPLAFAAYTNNSPPFQLTAALTTLIAGSFFSIQSTKLSLEDIAKNSFLSTTEKQLLSIKNDMIGHIREHRRLFAEMGYGEKIQAVSRFKQLKISNGTSSDYARLLFSNPPTKITPSRGSRALSRGIAVGGSLLTASYETAMVLYIWGLTKSLILESNSLAGSCAGLFVATGVYMTGKSVIYTCQRVFDMIMCRRQPDVGEQIRYKTAFCLKTVAILSSALANGATVVIWGDFFDSNEAEKLYFTSSLCASTFFVLLTFTFEVAENIIDELIQRYGSQADKKIINLNNALKGLEALIEKTSLQDCAHFLHHLPPQIRNHFLERCQLTSQALEEYLQQRTNV